MPVSLQEQQLPQFAPSQEDQGGERSDQIHTLLNRLEEEGYQPKQQSDTLESLCFPDGRNGDGSVSIKTLLADFQEMDEMVLAKIALGMHPEGPRQDPSVRQRQMNAALFVLVSTYGIEEAGRLIDSVGAGYAEEM